MSAQRIRSCRACFKAIPADAKFCPHCGAIAHREVAKTTEPTAPVINEKPLPILQPAQKMGVTPISVSTCSGIAKLRSPWWNPLAVAMKGTWYASLALMLLVKSCDYLAPQSRAPLAATFDIGGTQAPAPTSDFFLSSAAFDPLIYLTLVVLTGWWFVAFIVTFVRFIERPR